jgi:hypothetical protein
MKYLLKFEPVFSAGTVQAVLALIVALGFNLSAGVTGAIEAVAAAILALLVAFSVDKVTPVLFTGLLTAVGTLLIAFGVPHINSGEVSAANALVAIILASLLRDKVTPAAAIQVPPRHTPPSTPPAAA